MTLFLISLSALAQRHDMVEADDVMPKRISAIWLRRSSPPSRRTGFVAGSLPPTVFVNGSGFVEALTTVTVNGQPRPATINGFNDLSLLLTEGDLRAPGALKIAVANPAAPICRTAPVT